MKRIQLSLFTGICVGMFMVSPLCAEIYSWTDASGAEHFTDNYSSIPAHYRTKMKRSGEDGSPAPQAQPSAGSRSEVKKDGGRTEAAPAGSRTETAQPSVTDESVFGGKKIEEWKRELQTLENEINDLDQKVKQAEAERKLIGGMPPDMAQAVLQRSSDAVEKHNDAVDRYNKLVDTARKAGVPITPRK